MEYEKRLSPFRFYFPPVYPIIGADETARIFLHSETQQPGSGTLQTSTAHTLQDLLRYLPAAAVPSLVGLVSVAAFSRLLPPAEYGRYILVYTTVLFTHTVALSWMNQSVLRFFAREDPRHATPFFSTAVFGFLLLSAAVCLLWIAVLPWMPIDDVRLRGMLYLGPPVLFFYSGSMLMLGFLRAMRQSLRYSLLTSANAVLRFLAALVLIVAFGLQAEGVLWGLIAGALLVCGLEITRLSRLWKPSLRSFRPDILQRWAKYGLPLVGLALSNIVLAASDRYFLGYLLDASAVGIYAAGYRITETGLTAPVTFLMLATFPMLIQIYEKEGIPQTRKLMGDMLGLFFLVLTPVLILCILLARPIVDVLLGDAFSGAAGVIPWIAGGIFLMGLGVYTNKSFELREKTAALFGLYAVAALLNLILNAFLIPRLGMTGAAMATFGAYGSALVLSLWRGSRHLAWRFPWTLIRRVACAGAAMGISLILVPTTAPPLLDLVVKTTVGGGIYIAVAVMLCRRSAADTVAMLTGKHHPAGESE